MNKPIISIICALAQNRVIGKGNQIPWHIREDLIRFKQKTLHRTIIIGRATFESLVSYYKKSGKVMPDRNTIIVTKNVAYNPQIKNCFLVDSIERALERAKEMEKKEVFISGGEQIFKQTIHLAEKLYLTIVEGSFEGDKFFPDYSEFKNVVAREEKEEGQKRFVFLELVR